VKGTDPSRLLIAAALAFSAGAASSSCERSSQASDQPQSLAVPAEHPWVGPELSEFVLVDSRGSDVTRADLAGQPFILDFVFTTCAGPCPAMSARMRDMQAQLEGSDVRLVSVSVDPERDDPATLAEYAETLEADTQRWWFLTGEKDQIRELARSLQVAADPDPSPEAPLGFQVTHSTKFVVVDGEGRVRGYYDGTSEDGRSGAVARARHLAE